jgi:hypothetical protein
MNAERPTVLATLIHTSLDITDKYNTWAAGATSFCGCRLKNRQILGEFAKLRKATISFAMYVRPSVRTEQLGSHWTDFHEICYLRIYRKYVEKIQDS